MRFGTRLERRVEFKGRSYQDTATSTEPERWRRAAEAICCCLLPIRPNPTGDNSIWERQVIACLVAIPPRRQNLLISPNALPLQLALSRSCIFSFFFFSKPGFAEISLHLLLRRSKGCQKKKKTLSPPPVYICAVSSLGDFRDIRATSQLAASSLWRAKRLFKLFFIFFFFRTVRFFFRGCPLAAHCAAVAQRYNKK